MMPLSVPDSGVPGPPIGRIGCEVPERDRAVRTGRRQPAAVGTVGQIDGAAAFERRAERRSVSWPLARSIRYTAASSAAAMVPSCGLTATAFTAVPWITGGAGIDEAVLDCNLVGSKIRQPDHPCQPRVGIEDVKAPWPEFPGFARYRHSRSSAAAARSGWLYCRLSPSAARRALSRLALSSICAWSSDRRTQPAHDDDRGYQQAHRSRPARRAGGAGGVSLGWRR